MLWRWIGVRTVMLVGDLGTWPTIVGTEVKEEEWWRTGEWSMDEEELRRF